MNVLAKLNTEQEPVWWQDRRAGSMFFPHRLCLIGLVLCLLSSSIQLVECHLRM